jgi:hypothetical protein
MALHRGADSMEKSPFPHLHVRVLADCDATISICGPFGWFCLGLVSAGYLWPPQFREYLFYAPYDGVRGDEDQNQRDLMSPTTNNDLSYVVLSLKSEINSVKADVKNLEKKLDELIDLLKAKKV